MKKCQKILLFAFKGIHVLHALVRTFIIECTIFSFSIAHYAGRIDTLNSALKAFQCNEICTHWR